MEKQKEWSTKWNSVTAGNNFKKQNLSFSSPLTPTFTESTTERLSLHHLSHVALLQPAVQFVGCHFYKLFLQRRKQRKPWQQHSVMCSFQKRWWSCGPISLVVRAYSSLFNISAQFLSLICLVKKLWHQLCRMGDICSFLGQKCLVLGQGSLLQISCSLPVHGSYVKCMAFVMYVPTHAITHAKSNLMAFGPRLMNTFVILAIRAKTS